MNTKSIALTLLWGSLFMPATANGDESPVRVTVGIPPVAGLVERIGGKQVLVQVLAPSGQCMHDLALSPKQVGDLGKSRLLITVGMPFEERLTERVRTMYSAMTIIDAAEGIEKRKLDTTCRHGEDAAADHACGGGIDPHVWLSPSGLKIMSNNIATALEKVDPEQAATYRANLAEVAAEIDKVAAHLKKALGPLRGKTIWVYHPTFGYLADAYEINQKAIETGGKTPAAKELRELIRRARADGVKAIFAEPQADLRGARLVAEAVGCVIVPLDPLAKDVVKNLDEMAGKLQSALGEGAKN